MKNNRFLTVIFNIFSALFITVGYLLLFSANWFESNFDVKVGFDAVLFTLFSNMNGVDTTAVERFFRLAVLPTIAFSALTYTVLMWLPKWIMQKRLTERKGKWIHQLTALGLALILCIALTRHSVLKVGLDDYIASRGEKTQLFDDEYVAPEETEITFPEEKRNLIYIYLESMEVTFMSEAQGGASPVDYIPELSSLAENNLNFSQSEGLGGGRTTTGSTWTIAAMISQTSGIPLCLPDGIWENGLNYYSQVIPGVTTLNDILHENGYTQALMVGSDASFGGRREYFTQHGVDRIYDLFTAREEGIVPEDYWNNFWGYEDFYLFRYAKEKITELSMTEEPFAFTMLTVDTHHPDGYKCIYCEDNYGEFFEDTTKELGNNQFANVMSCSSKQVAEFVEWIQAQDFYENTTIIITGDHNSMNSQYMNEHVSDDYTRRIYNCFLNTATDALNPKNRDFTTLDMFPTTLAAIGCTIEGDRLGLGTNLFSDEKTLAERYGFDYLCAEINKTSPYYENNFLYGKKTD